MWGRSVRARGGVCRCPVFDGREGAGGWQWGEEEKKEEEEEDAIICFDTIIVTSLIDVDRDVSSIRILMQIVFCHTGRVSCDDEPSLRAPAADPASQRHRSRGSPRPARLLASSPARAPSPMALRVPGLGHRKPGDLDKGVELQPLRSWWETKQAASFQVSLARRRDRVRSYKASLHLHVPVPVHVPTPMQVHVHACAHENEIGVC